MSDLTDEPAAFPRLHNGHHQNMHGMSLRDYFAAAALATGELFDARDLGPIADHDKFRIEARRIADAAYGLADAMLKARESRHGK